MYGERARQVSYRFRKGIVRVEERLALVSSIFNQKAVRGFRCRGEGWRRRACGYIRQAREREREAFG